MIVIAHTSERKFNQLFCVLFIINIILLFSGATNAAAQLVCVLKNEPPPTEIIKGTNSVCDASHLCHSVFCVDPQHLVFEPHAVNLM
jgi:hypothetical protein